MTMVLTIAGSDSCGGAGIQADIKTFCAHGVSGASVITAVSAQNAKRIIRVDCMSRALVHAQIEAVMETMPIDALKIGLIGNAAVARTIAQALRKYAFSHIVLDPVIVASSGHAFLDEEAVAILRDELIPMATLVTPNLPEAALLLNCAVPTHAEGMLPVLTQLRSLGAESVLLKGGHVQDALCVDMLSDGAQVKYFSAPRISVNAQAAHGTGCTLAAAITALLAKGETLPVAIAKAKTYVGKQLSQES